jgi:hypothetical protein
MSQPSKESSATSRDGYVAEIMAREAEDAARAAPVRERRSRLPLLLVLSAVLVALTAWNAWRMMQEPAVFPVAGERDAARLSIALIAQEIEAFADSARVFPSSLQLIAMDDEDVEYAKTDSTYTLTVQLSDSAMVYHSGENLTPYFEAFERLQRGPDNE